MKNDSKVYVIDGDPTAQIRARFGNKNVWDPMKQLKVYVGIMLQKQHGNLPLYENVPLSVTITFFMKMPKGSKRDGQYHYFKPDTDNLEKFLFDACNKIIWKDDCQISEVYKRKIYDKNPRTEFTVRVLK